MRHDPRFGYTYMPSVKLRVPTPNGGYLVCTNTAGFRSEREFVSSKPPNRLRVLLYGDSQTAGDGVSDKLRFSDLLESEIPGLEVYNYGVSGTSVDQHFLIYTELPKVEHDLVVVAFYVENILRIRRRVVRARDPAGNEIFRAKPYFELVGDELRLRNVPVRQEPWTPDNLPPELVPHVYRFGEANLVFRHHGKHHDRILATLAHLGPLRHVAKRWIAKLRRFQPLPSYDAPTNEDWLLLKEIFKKWIAASRTPVLVTLIPLESALDGLTDANNCQRRFQELAEETGCEVYDLLPDLLRLAPRERLNVWSYRSGHLSTFGHRTVARLLAGRVRQLMSTTKERRS